MKFRRKDLIHFNINILIFIIELSHVLDAISYIVWSEG